MRTHTSLVFKALALAAAASLAACGGGTSNTTPAVHPSPSSSTVLNNIVGVGDSLTAGEQAGGVLGDGTLADPFYPGINVPPTQESGWWSQFYIAATGGSYAAMADPATSVLPLINKPGLADQLVPNNPAVTTVALPFLPLSTQPGGIAGHGCDSFNQAAYSRSTFAATRMNATAQPKDVAIPGLTIHEAATLYQPPSPTCTPLAGAPPSILLLQQLLSESEDFYPVLGTFPAGTTELSAAISLKPTLTTVWLGPNDVLHFAFSGGAFTGVDNATQAQADMTNIITSLQKAGSAVVVANVPNVLQLPFYFSVATPPNAQACQLQNFMVCNLETQGLPAANAAAIVSGIAAKYNLGANGYLTLSGFLDEAAQNFNADLDKDAPGGNGLGSMYVTPAFATAIQNQNDAIDTGIAAAVKATGAAFVDMKTVENDIATGNLQDPAAAQALSVNPGKCCSLAFLGGLQSFDGLHPSNTGYALIADAFIQAVDTTYGTTIAPIDPKAVYNGTGEIPFPDPYAQH